MLIQCVIFDLDDTLIHTAVVYQATLAKAIQVIASEGIDVTHAHAVYQQVEVELIGKHGFSRERYPLSLRVLYEQLAQQQGFPARNPIIHQMQKLGWDLYKHNYEVKEGAERLLRVMKFANYRMILVTKGDDEIQRAKAERAGLLSYFDTVIVLGDKTPETWAEVVKQEQLDPALCFVVGDSVRSDVNASIAVGFNAIHIPSGHEWFFEKAELHPTALVKSHLDELLDTFRVRQFIAAEFGYSNRPELDLKRATYDGHMMMTNHHALRQQMPNCLGLPYLFTFGEEGGTFREIHAVFEREHIEIPGLPGVLDANAMPGEELARATDRWAPSGATPESVRQVRQRLPARLCKSCDNLKTCLAQNIINGVKSPA